MKLLGMLIGIILILIGVYVLKEMLAFFLTLDPNVKAALITALAATAGVLFNQRYNKIKEIREAHRSHKVQLYQEFILKIGESLKNSKELPEGIDDFIRKFICELIIWGSPDVIKKYQNFHKKNSDVNPNERILLFLDDLYQAMRKDLQNSNKNLKRGDLIKLFLEDPEKVDELLECR